jgi:hypothetical protein
MKQQKVLYMKDLCSPLWQSFCCTVSTSGLTLWFFRVAGTQLVINVVQDVVQVLSRVYVCVVFSAPSGQTLMHIVE